MEVYIYILIGILCGIFICSIFDIAFWALEESWTLCNTKTKSFWETIAPKEYGFWANVNPKVPHRRWSQEYERDIETGNKYPTKLFNGYEQWISSLYPNQENKLFFY